MQKNRIAVKRNVLTITRNPSPEKITNRLGQADEKIPRRLNSTRDLGVFRAF